MWHFKIMLINIGKGVFGSGSVRQSGTFIHQPFVNLSNRFEYIGLSFQNSKYYETATQVNQLCITSRF